MDKRHGDGDMKYMDGTIYEVCSEQFRKLINRYKRIGYSLDNMRQTACIVIKKVREKSRECHYQKPQPFPDPKRKRKPTNLNKHKPNKRTKSTKISSLFPKRGNRNTKRTEKHKNKMTHTERHTTNRLGE